MDLFNTDRISFWVVAAIVVITAVVGIWIYRRAGKENKPLSERRKGMEAELRAAEDEFRAERQRLERANAACPTSLPLWAENKVMVLQYRISGSHDAAKRNLIDVGYDIRNCEFNSARTHLEHFDQNLRTAFKDIHKLAGIETRIMRFRRNAERKAEAALALVGQIQALGKALSDQGVMLKIGEFDAFQSAAEALRMSVEANGEGVADKSEQILLRAEKLSAHAEVFKHSLEYVAALRAYVPKRIAEHQHRPGDLMSRNGDAVRTLERIKSSSAAHLWFGLDQQLKEVPGMLTRAKLSFALASEMHAAQSWSAAKQEAEAAVALADEAELIFDEISELDARLTAAQEKVIKIFGETKIAVMSAVRMTEGHEDVSVTAKQLAIRALCAFERASYLISAVDAFDHIGAVESLGHARQFAEAALDRAKLDATPVIDIGPDINLIVTEPHGQGDAAVAEPAPEPVRCFGGPYGVAGAGISE